MNATWLSQTCEHLRDRIAIIKLHPFTIPCTMVTSTYIALDALSCRLIYIYQPLKRLICDISTPNQAFWLVTVLQPWYKNEVKVGTWCHTHQTHPHWIDWMSVTTYCVYTYTHIYTYMPLEITKVITRCVNTLMLEKPIKFSVYLIQLQSKKAKMKLYVCRDTIEPSLESIHAHYGRFLKF